MYRVYQPNFPIDSNKVTNGYGEIWLIDPVELILLICFFNLGDHKKRAKYRFASKTLMRILPADMKNEVEDLINKKTMTLDLYEILGQCTWGQAKSL